MDRRSWPWKKKSSDKLSADRATVLSDSAGVLSDSTAPQADKPKQDGHKKPKYVQLSLESYSHLTGLEDQVKSYEEQLKSYEDQLKSYDGQVKGYQDQVNSYEGQVEAYEDQMKSYEDQVKAYEGQVKSLEEEVDELNEKLSASQSEIAVKENLVKQHSKVAEDAVSGWEKAEAEAAALKTHLESATLLKLAAEERATHLDGALKECLQEIRSLKEEHEQDIQEVVLTMTDQFDRMKLEFEAKIQNLEQDLHMSSAENVALSRSLQERSDMLINMTEEKSRGEAEIAILRGNIESCEKDISSFKYELHIAAKELEIRNEEKNMSVRSSEIANKQHSEGTKKITKLEAECQRLRGLVRKKLPGPAAVAQMKLEVENMGRDHVETRIRKSPGKPSSPQFAPSPEFSPDSVQKYQKANELLTKRLVEFEEETKMLKEVLTKRSSDLQASRSVCAKAISSLQALEARLKTDTHMKSTTRTSILLPIEVSLSQNASNSPSLTSVSGQGNDDNSCSGSWDTALISELSHLKTEINIGSPKNAEHASQLELMDDFLEMEKLANTSSGSHGAMSGADISCSSRSGVVSHELVEHTFGIVVQPKQQPEFVQLEKQFVESDGDKDSLGKLKSRVSALLDLLQKDCDMEKVYLGITRVVEGMQNEAPQDHNGRGVKATHVSEGTSLVSEKDVSLSQDGQDSSETHHRDQELLDAVLRIHDFILLVGKEYKAVPGKYIGGNCLNQKLVEFSAAFNEFSDRGKNLVGFVICFSHILSEATKLFFHNIGYSNYDAEIGSPDCVDKVVLPENKVIKGSLGDRFLGCVHLLDSPSDPDTPHEGCSLSNSESNFSSCKYLLVEFEQLKLEKENSVMDLARCIENLESTRSQLEDTKRLLAETKSQLISAQKFNVLADTQLKCMAESYKSQEARAADLQTQVNMLQAKIEMLNSELQEQKNNHQESELRSKDLEDQLQRISGYPAADVDVRTNQDMELAAAAEKLAECQETIFLLGKHLKGLRPQSDAMLSLDRERIQNGGDLIEDSTITGGTSVQMVTHTGLLSPSNSESGSPVRLKISKHRPTRSVSSSSSSTPTSERNACRSSRFFSTKAHLDY